MRIEKVRERLTEVREIAERLNFLDCSIYSDELALIGEALKSLCSRYLSAKENGEIYVNHIKKPLNKIKYELLRIERDTGRRDSEKRKRI